MTRQESALNRVKIELGFMVNNWLMAVLCNPYEVIGQVTIFGRILWSNSLADIFACVLAKPQFTCYRMANPFIC